MSVIGYILLGIFLWFVYNLTIKVILPVYRTTSRLKKQFRNMADQQQSQNRQYEQPEEPKIPKEGEYIDFEEVK